MGDGPDEQQESWKTYSAPVLRAFRMNQSTSCYFLKACFQSFPVGDGPDEQQES